MADNFLERHRRDYEERKAEWLRKKKHIRLHKSKSSTINKTANDDQ